MVTSIWMVCARSTLTSLSWQRRAEPRRPQVTWRKIVEDRTCSSEDMIAGRQARARTHTHTHTQTDKHAHHNTPRAE